MTVSSIDAPVLAGSRPRAQQILNMLPDGDLSQYVVQLECGSMIAATVSFADEIIRTVLVDRKAARLEVTNASDQEFIGYLKQRAKFYHVEDRLQFAS
ncbi:hypothetical protein GAN17_22535 [Mycobacterium kubicae]|uniref:hypothetical protein n=1 Tax=Mycobacterium kubicae TaxID=120959 RepID=UPI00163E5511|nr:hypothetical protein [Mycobacterium kubicae]QNI08720.1 hypothetical protein GAN17_22535 [Mycobacterium kubicae]